VIFAHKHQRCGVNSEAPKVRLKYSQGATPLVDPPLEEPQRGEVTEAITTHLWCLILKTIFPGALPWLDCCRTFGAAHTGIVTE
jgi:hypothetical protein